jgi:THO complex subunit 4
MTSPYVQCLSTIIPTPLTSNQELFNRIGPVLSARLLYDRSDRSQGTAFVTYEDPRDARIAVREFDGANANGQPIRLTQLSAGSGGGGARRGQAAEGGSLFDRIEKPSRSMFERIDSSDDVGTSRRRGGGGRRDDRSYSPRKGLRVPEGVDRYEPGGRDSRSPMPGRRGGGGRERGGRRPGARREETGRGGGRGKREDGKPSGGPRPKKTAEELDAEMEDYFGGGGAGAETNNGNAQQQNGGGSAPAAPAAVGDDDIDMIE